MENQFMNGCKKLLFAAVIIISLLGVLPKNVSAAVKMDQKKVTCTAKERFTLKVKGTSKKATWSSSNKAIATVTKKGGNVVTKKAGKVTITAKVGSKKVKCKVTVKAPVNAKVPFVVKSKTLRVGESFLLIDGWFTNYESTTSFNERIATIDNAGRVVAKGVGTTTVMVNCGKDKNGNYIDYNCKITVVSGSAPTCNHQWMDASKYNASGKLNGHAAAFIRKVLRTESVVECNECGERFIEDADMDSHYFSTGHMGTTQYWGSKSDGNICKFDHSFYCRNCGLQRD